jgi:hypothetical protein
VAEFRFTREFLNQLAAIERVADQTELDTLDAGLAEVVANPLLPDRFATHYDPAEPSYFVRRDPFLIRYSVEEDTGTVVFRTLFRRTAR